MNCIIVDDEETARAVVEHLCKNVESLHVSEQFSNAIQAIKYLNQNKVDLIFLDIHMPDFTGFDFIQTLKDPPKVILTTSDKDLAIEAFEYDCIVDYLVKPITPPRFLKAIEKANKTGKVSKSQAKEFDGKDESERDNQLYINIDRRLIKIDLPSICLIEAKGDY